MPKMPETESIIKVSLKWDQDTPFECPLCGSRMRHEFNDGGRRLIDYRKKLWIVTNYYSCTNKECRLSKAFPIAYENTIRHKKFSLNIWSRVVLYRERFKLSYTQIKGIAEADWNVLISINSVKSIVELYNKLNQEHSIKETREVIKKQGEIVLSLDGAQPFKNEPALWIFMDMISGRILKTVFLDNASAEVLCDIMKELESFYNVKIRAVISDKQRNIVKAVKMMGGNIKHCFCQYHFLSHISKPISLKDSHLLKNLRSKVKKFSIIVNCKKSNSNELYNIFKPLAEELELAISTKGDRFSIFPGYECYKNLAYILDKLKSMNFSNISAKYLRSFNSVKFALEALLNEYEDLFKEIAELLPKYNELRNILNKRDQSSDEVKAKFDQWTSSLKQLVKNLGFNGTFKDLKYKSLTYRSSRLDIYLEWIRLSNSYYNGLFYAYDDKNLKFTNNKMESIIGQIKRHFRQVTGNINPRDLYYRNALYTPFIDAKSLTFQEVRTVLIAVERPIFKYSQPDYFAAYYITKKNWRIREVNTGNLEKFEKNLRKC